MKDYMIWQEADAATAATGDPTAISGWHLILDIPVAIPASRWTRLVTGFVEHELAAQGAATAWAVHALEGIDNWLETPHAHLIVNARGWRHDARHGRRARGRVGSWGGQRSLELAWGRACWVAAQPFWSLPIARFLSH